MADEIDTFPIQSIKVENFTGLANFEIKLNEGLNIITGINGSGKTKLLDYLHQTFAMETKEIAPYHMINKTKDKCEYICVLWRLLGDCGIDEITSLVVKSKKSYSEILFESLKNISYFAIYDLMMEYYAIREKENAEGKSTLTEAKDFCTKNDPFKAFNDNLNSLKTQYTKELSFLDNIKWNIDDIDYGKFHELAFKIYKNLNNNFITQQQMSPSYPSRSNTEDDFISYSKQKRNKEANEDKIKEFVPFIIPNHLSTGQMIILYFVLSINFAKSTGKTLFLIDELDAHLNPALMKVYLQLLRDLSKTAQVFVTTHNPFLIDLATKEEIFTMQNGILIKPKKKDSVVQSISDGMLSIKNVQGIARLFANNKKN